jgi:hypothetical protein
VGLGVGSEGVAGPRSGGGGPSGWAAGRHTPVGAAEAATGVEALRGGAGVAVTMRGVKVAGGRATVGCFGGVAVAGTYAGLGVGVGVLPVCGAAVTGFGATVGGLTTVAIGPGVGGGAACARVENEAATPVKHSAQIPSATVRAGRLYTFAICETPHTRACVNPTLPYSTSAKQDGIRAFPD